MKDYKTILKKYKFTDEIGHPLENCQDFLDLLDTVSYWQPIETAPKDGRAILLLSEAYEIDMGEYNGGIIQIAPKAAIGSWHPDGTSWVDEKGNPNRDEAYTLAVTGFWLSGGGWFQPNEVTHWRELPLPPKDN